MIFTHFKSIGKIVTITLFFGSISYSANLCKQVEVIDKQIETLLNSPKVEVEELKKLYNRCKNRKTRIAYLIKRGDENRDNSLLKSAKLDYKEALALIEENNFRIFEKYREYLKVELGIKQPTIKKEGKVTPRGVIDSNALESYITKRGKQTRGAGLESFSRLKGIPINFNTGSSTIQKGVNLAQAKEIGKLLSKPKYANEIVYITGYTDTRGSAIYNKELSQARANGLKRYLVEQFHLKDKNLITEGLGESFPVYNEKGIENYYQSRRVTLEYGE
jgi:outer membrane protein OmpA-like peptidoglycan-associated protein